MGTAVAALLIGAAAATASGAQSETPPPPPTPAWVNADGTVDESKMPEAMPLIGADGKVVKDANGKTLKVKTRGLLKPSGAPVAPKSAPAPKAGETRTTETDADGRVTENVQAQPSVPPAN
ncbi:hypothetical protein OG698_01075 [Streptomyces sp. NBC_01003]|uniref:hypothetical protein n=1 Tax=Streptomyces sp. NBC_01003 TaxID=2903714 RepID=UPI0038654B91|nr:hypothetical protein OG698_01075 [Streptomyces sp. NBC_01003]